MKKGVVFTVMMAVISLMICIHRWRSGVPLGIRGIVETTENRGDDQSGGPAVSTPASTAPEAASLATSQPSSSSREFRSN